jgi:hypothetical protein
VPYSIRITIKAITMEGLGAIDPQVTVDIAETPPLQMQVARQAIHNFDTEATLVIPSPDSSPTWHVNITFSRYDVVGGFFLQPRANPVSTHTVQVVRLPNRWTPQFDSLNALASPRFDPFKSVVAVSNNVDLKNGPAVGDLHANYDNLADNAQILGKNALLNLFAVLSDEQEPIGNVPWFSYVRKIVRIDQERFVAEVDAELFENVQTILSQLDSKFAAQGYFTERAADLPLHIPNIPPQYDSARNLVDIITLKKNYEQGNVQWTLSFLRGPDRAVHLLDCDMDEHRNIVAHGLDLVKHLVNGGTSPIAMHEYIVKDSAQQAADKVATIDLGYRLV